MAWVPSNGAAPAMQDLAAGGVDLATCSVPEARAHHRGRQGAQPRADGSNRNPAFPDVPTLKEAIGVDYTTGAWRGIAGPKGLPAAVAKKLTAALKKVFDFKEFKEFMCGPRLRHVCWATPPSSRRSWPRATSKMGDAMKAAGLEKA